MWVAMAVGAALALRMLLAVSVLISDARRWVRISASVVTISTAIALIFALDGMMGLGVTKRTISFWSDTSRNVILGVMLLDLVGSTFLVATSFGGKRVTTTLLITAGLAVVVVQAISSLFCKREAEAVQVR